jgi:hypothetical protein
LSQFEGIYDASDSFDVVLVERQAPVIVFLNLPIECLYCGTHIQIGKRFEVTVTYPCNPRRIRAG